MEPRLHRPRLIAYGTMFIALLAMTPWLGWWIPLPLVTAAVVVRLAERNMARRAKPEYLLAAGLVTTQIIIGVSVVATGASQSPISAWFVFALLALAPRFSKRGVVAGFVIIGSILLLSTVAIDLSGFVDDPVQTLASAAMLIGVAAFSVALSSSELRHRGEAAFDPLTGLLNRKSLAARFEEVRQQARVTGRPVSLLLCDIDRFKAVNDTYGHHRGDEVLRDVGREIRAALRSFELVYRLGGEEFLVIVPGLDVKEAAAVAERVRVLVVERQPGGVAVTVSLGVSAGRGEEIDYRTLFGRADEALYQAKQGGRDCVVEAPGSPPELGGADAPAVHASDRAKPKSVRVGSH
ncbi:MAG: diguanylate cyclase [Actinobacteria bacterium]|nr:diguanylate cyclase [Actinomycetota bacterium]